MAKKSKNGKKIGRPTKLAKPEIAKVITETICQNIRDSAPRKAAVCLAGVSYKTYLEWLDRAENGEEPFLHFRNQIELAEFEKQQELMGKWETHCDNDWRAIDRLLQVRFKEEFGETKGDVNITGEQIVVVIPQQSDSAGSWQDQVKQHLSNNGLRGNGSDGNPSLAHKP